MPVNQAGIDLIKSYEGLRLDAYQDAVGVWTIGYGHTGPDVTAGLRITQAEAEELLRKDLERFERGVANALKVPVNPNQFAALVSWAYNVGLSAADASTLMRKVNARDWQGAADEFLRWNKAGNTVLPGLTRRRQAERALFLQGLPEAPPSDWLLICPAEDWKRTRRITDAELELLKWAAEGSGAAFRVDSEARKVWFLRRAAAPSDGPNLKSLMKPGDIHIVADRKSRTASAFDHAGAKLWSVDVLMEGVAGGTVDQVKYDVRASDTPPGLWRCTRVDDLVRGEDGWRAYGWHYIYLEPLSGPALELGRAGIGWHGGGSASPDPWAPDQGLYPTEGCLRSRNRDLREQVVPTIRKALAAGRQVYLTTG